ncbi:MAG: CDP-alcohol phosphatidyltransferase family protein [Solirubrobacteraceae bacterium]
MVDAPLSEGGVRREPGDAPADRRAPLSFRRLSGLDRSGPPPAQTAPGAPLRPWTIPNAIGFLRLALIPLFLVLAFSSRNGRDTAAAVLFAVVGWSDYADGIAARLTGQYSRLGALMDPLIDRLLVISGLAVCWHFNLLPRTGIALLVARELIMLLVSQVALRRGIELSINWLGRAGVWPAMAAPFFAMVGAHGVAVVCLWLGLLLAYAATASYLRDGLSQPRHLT